MKTKLILEIGCNHQGNLDLAKKMIDTAAKLGVYGVKFQKRDIASIPEEIRNAPRDPVKDFGSTYEKHREALEFSQDQIYQLRLHAQKSGLEFACTAFDPVSVKELLEIGIEYVKFPSQLLLNEKMYESFRKNNDCQSKLMVSTGMHNVNEILEALFFCPDIVYHCISMYPAMPKDSNIRFITALCENQIFAKSDGRGYQIGYSSHEENGCAIPYAVTAGATWVERHFTLDKSLKGHDHKTVSSTPEEIKKIIKNIEIAEEIGGDGKRILTYGEIKVAEKFRSDK